MSKKISQLNEGLVIDGSEFIPISKVGVSLKLTLNRIKSLFTKADVGLSNVDNTSDIDKPLSNSAIQALNTKADTGHVHSIQQVTALEATLNNKANVSHSHTVDSVTGLQGLLDLKAPVSHIHSTSQISGLDQTLASKAALSHTHTKADVGLGNVDNTSDINKPLSTAQKTYIDNAITVTTGSIQW